MRNEKRIPIVLDIIPWFNFIQNNTGISKFHPQLYALTDNIIKK